MTDAARRIPSFDELYAEIERLPEGVTGEILEPGVLRTMSRPGRAHRRSAQQCFRSLGGADEASGGTGWWIEQEAEILLPGERLAVPDLSGWRVERLPELPDDNPVAVVSDWCCEVLSPTTARDDRGLKLPLYARSGIAWIWLVDPTLRLVEVFESVGGRPQLAETAKDDDKGPLAPFGIDIDLARWWLAASAPARRGSGT